MNGEIKNFTGVDSPYEAPENPEIHLQTLGKSAEEMVRGPGTLAELALAAGREVMRVFHAGCAVDRGRSRVLWALTDGIVVAVPGDLAATFSP